MLADQFSQAAAGALLADKAFDTDWAGDLSKLVANTARAIEVTQLEERIRKIEEAQAAKGGA